ncbi:MAG: Arsenate reductase thioredoxin-coupled [uncultured Pyrinomonadaceae bacterium]|uniref:Arsenate reductase thioredoxin-coupled n=1 Tax=uncultured Pyrinomonadaceae bacterium TaxID=2283094 RepID=A0A6J4PEA3_9BACT|nr:MAG: Arsenate reductase thioredoxin-coupled [uncultured Pyrinomonadaceae bacterium]
MRHRSKSIEEFAGRNFDFIITVCDNAKDSCPFFPGSATRIHQNFTDPPPTTAGDDEARLKIFREVRDQLREWLNDFVRSEKS